MHIGVSLSGKKKEMEQGRKDEDDILTQNITTAMKDESKASVFPHFYCHSGRLLGTFFSFLLVRVNEYL